MFLLKIIEPTVGKHKAAVLSTRPDEDTSPEFAVE
jgi:hypothetical protein